MRIPCPKCNREFEGTLPSNPTMMMRCPLCGSPFKQEEIHSRSQSPSRNPPPPEENTEEWEFSAEELDNFDSHHDLQSVQDDFSLDIDDDFSLDQDLEGDPGSDTDHVYSHTYDPSQNTPPKNQPISSPSLQNLPNSAFIPDLPNTSPALAEMVEKLSWNSSLDLNPDGDAAELPDLPQLEELQEAPTYTPQNTPPKTIRHHKIPPGRETAPHNRIERPLPKTESREETIDDLLRSIDDTRPSSTRYLIRRGTKVFGPFSEEKILSLLEHRKLIGDEETSQEGHDTWQPLGQWPDFRAMVQAMQKKSFRVGWEPPKRKQKRKPQSTEEMFEPSPPPNTPLWKRTPLLITLALFISIPSGWALWTTLRTPTNTHSLSCQPPQKTLTSQLTLKDDYNAHISLFERLKVLHQDQQKPQCWSRIRFAFQLLDSHGDDDNIRPKAEQILADFTQKSKDPLLLKKALMSQAIAKRDNAEIKDSLSKLKQSSLTPDLDWLYLKARGLELTQQPKRALKAYNTLIKKSPNHLRGLLGLYRYHREAGEFKTSNALLVRALKLNPNHLPSMLHAAEDAQHLDFWKKRIGPIQERIKTAFQKRMYTMNLLAQRSYLQAKKLWKQSQSGQALLLIDKAIRLSSQNEQYRWTRIQYYLQDGQLALVKQFLKKEQHNNDYPHPKLWRWEIQLLLKQEQWEKANTRIKDFQKIGLLQPQRRYTYHDLKGQLLEAKGELLPALKQFKFAEKSDPSNKKIIFKQARIFKKLKQPQQCLQKLKRFLKYTLPKTPAAIRALALLSTCKQQTSTKTP